MGTYECLYCSLRQITFVQVTLYVYTLEEQGCMRTKSKRTTVCLTLHPALATVHAAVSGLCKPAKSACCEGYHVGDYRYSYYELRRLNNFGDIREIR